MKKPSLMLLIFLRMFVLLALFFVVLTWFTISSYRTFFYNTTQNELFERASMCSERFTQLLENTPSSTGRIRSEVNQLAKKGNIRITIILPDGNVIADSHENPRSMENHISRPEIQAAIETGNGHNVRFSNTLDRRMMYSAIKLINNETHIGILRMAVSTEALSNELIDLISKIILGGLVIVIGSAISAWWISRRISRPLEVLKGGAVRISNGQLMGQLPAFTTRELDEMSKAMNRMALDLQKRIQTITTQQHREKQIVSNMMDGIITINPNGLITTLNPSAAHLLHVSETHTPGKEWQKIIESPELENFIQDCLENRYEHAEEIFFIDLRKQYLQARFGILRTPQDNTYNGALILLQDVTQSHQMEIMRKDFVSSVSHELRTPVTAIKGFVETLLDNEGEMDPTTVNFLQIIGSHSDRLINIVNDLLSLSKIEYMNERSSIEFEATEVEKPVLQAVHFCKENADEHNIELKTVCEPGVQAYINEQLITQACINLIDNAIKYSRPHTQVTVSCYRDFQNKICISVSDHGIGIPEKHHNRVFERFYRIDKARSRQLGGTGLGLAIVKHIVRAHNGSINLSSREEIGSTFIITLPAL